VGTLVVLASGLWYFRSNESAIVDFV
jgi:hypothetical protein